MAQKDNKKIYKQMAEAILSPLDQKINSNSKDGVFCDLFKDPFYLLQLYLALHPEDNTTDIDDITLVTLENQMLRQQYNDLGFIVGNRLMILIEEQSLWTLNILIRILMYLGETYQRYIKNNRMDIYGTKTVIVPKPELYVLYPKERGNLPDEILLSRDIFGISDPDGIFVDVKAKIIYDGQKGDIINQYIIFTRVFDEQVKIYGKTEKAVTETIKICRDRNVLKNYLIKEEVPDIMFAHLDKEQQMEYVFEQGREQGLEQGLEQGHEQGLLQGHEQGQFQTLVGLAKKKYITIEQAAEEAGMSVDAFLEKMRIA